MRSSNETTALNVITDVFVESISGAVPKQHLSLLEFAPDLLTEKTVKRMTKGTGFESLRIAPDNVTASDLVVRAAQPILQNIDKHKIRAVVFVSQSSDYNVPATSHILQDRLGLDNGIFCVDIIEGCAGFLKGLYTAFLLSKQLNASVLLANGDTMSRLTSPKDRATRCIFGDAGAVTLISPRPTASTPFDFVSFGDCFDTIIIENSGARKIEHPKNDGFIYMDGIAVLNFTLDRVPDMIARFLAANGLTKDDVTLYAFHQANQRILTALADKLEVPRDKVPFMSSNVGNVSSASIPLALALLNDTARFDRVLCCGFGVGMTIGVCLLDCSKTNIYGVQEYE